jgi:two-component system chemotaxis response regulator CheY
MRILIVDDDLLGRIVLRKLLGNRGDCDMAVNGREAVEAFRMAREEDKPYDLICMDILMPEMDGLEALKAIRGYEEERGIFGLQRVKVIMITGKDDSKSVLTSFREGCEGYVVKPVERENLEKQIKELGLGL